MALENEGRVSSLHMVQITNHPNYQQSGEFEEFSNFIEHNYKHYRNGELSWYILSSDEYNKLHHDFSKMLKEPVPVKAKPIEQRVIAGVHIRTDALVKDAPSYTLFVIRVYHPNHSDVANPRLKEIYDDLVAR